MSKCKEALSASSGNLEEAVHYLRKKGMASAAKKEGRETKEGVVVSAETDTHVALLEVNAETDFVVKNERFQAFAKDLVEQIATSKPSSIDAFLQETYAKDTSLTIDAYRNLVIQSLGENIQLKRLELIEKKKDLSIGIYSHMGGKILAAVAIQGSASQQDLAKQVAMHVAAYSPDFLQPSDVPESIQEKEKEIARAQMQGKPDHIIDKILTGKMKAFYDENCLVSQPFVKDSSKSVQEFVAAEGKKEGQTLQVSSFWCWKIGS